MGIQFPLVEDKAAPPALLAQLRAIDPTVELVHFGGGDWRLGAVMLTDERVASGEAILGQLLKQPLRDRNIKTVLLGMLSIQGFAQIEKYFASTGDISGTVYVEGGLDGKEGYLCTVLEDFRERDHAWRKDQGAAKFAERLYLTSNEPARVENEKQRQEWLRTDGRDHYNREVRNRKTFGYGGGETGGTGKIILPFGG